MSTWGSEAESDSIPTLMKKSLGKNKKGKKVKKSRSLSSTEPRTSLESVTSSTPCPPTEPYTSSEPITPSTPYHCVIESSTGFSPLNTSASLPAVSENSEDTVSLEFGPESPPLRDIPEDGSFYPPCDIPADEPPSPPRPASPSLSDVLERSKFTAPRSRSRSPSVFCVRISSPSSWPSPVDRAPSSIPPTPATPAVTRPPYREVRPQLFQKAFVQSIGGAKFNDTQIHIVSARTRAGTAHKPRVLHARSAFLEAASLKFEDEIYDACTVNGSSISCTCSRIDYGYDGDSDLEDCEQDPPIPSARATKDADKQPETISFDQLFEDLRRRTAGRVNIILNPRTSPGPSDIVSLDESESESGLSDLVEEARQQIQVPDAPMCVQEDGLPTAVCTPLRPVLKLKTSDPASAIEEQLRTPEMVPAALENLDALRLDTTTQEKSASAPITAVPVGVATASTNADAANDESKTEKKVEAEDTVLANGERVLFIKDSAHKTWQALLLYLYNDHLNFAPLHSEGRRQPDAMDDKPRCSPKSMYRLADKLGLADPKQSAFEAIQRGLSRDNIVKELFSDFTWRYPEVLQMEAGVFFRHCTEPTVQAAMSETFQDIAYGQLPHSSVVLDSLFKKFALETRNM
ncbi:hypothetical protein EIP86_003371 [Pleurotus ostreatoroseus]|nr:hypothetical protein EIP86_003371 [Pleurotus ostreatoroseus]